MVQTQITSSDQFYPLQQRLPLQQSSYQNDLTNPQVLRDSYATWDRKIYTNLQSSRYCPYNAELRFHSKLPLACSQTAQITSLSVRASSEYGIRSTTESHCDLFHNGHFTSLGSQSEMNPGFYQGQLPQSNPLNGLSEPIFPPPTEMPLSQQIRHSQQVISPHPLGFAPSQPPCVQIPAYYSQQNFFNGGVGRQGFMLHERQILSTQV